MTQLAFKGFEPVETKVIKFPYQDIPTQSKPRTETLTVNKPIIDKEYHDSSHNESNPMDAFTPEEIQIMLNYLWNTPSRYKDTNIRNYLYISFSVNTSRRPKDIVSLRVCDVLTKDGEIKTHLHLKESKTGKYSRTPLNIECQKALVKYFNLKGTYTMSEYLFPKYTSRDEHNTVPGMRMMLQRLAKKLVSLHPEYIEQGLFAKHYGTYSLRKTMPRHVLDTSNNPKDISTVSNFLMHSDPKVTSRYLNIRQEDIDDMVYKFGIGEE